MLTGSSVYRAAVNAVVLALSLGACSLTGCSLDRGALIKTQRGAGSGGGADGASGSGDGGSNAAADSGGAGALGTAGTSATAGVQAGGAGTGSSIDVCGGCDDGMFCNGVESCAPNDITADARGCISSPACHSNQLCDEVADSCATDCSKNSDADGDGYDAISCGGDDCNDAALAAHPDGVELCDGLDNDCNSVMDDGFAQLSCLRDRTFASCVFGHCVVSACDQGYADCDGVASNGCEQQLDATPGDCQTADCMSVASADDSDAPADDDNECTLEYCSSGVAVVEDAPDDTACDRDKSVCKEGVCQ